MQLIISLITVYLFTLVKGEVCENPEVASTYYSNTDEKLIEDTVFIVEFDVKCSNKPEHLPLYADIDGKQYPVTSSPDSDHRQVSWSVSGKSQSRLYDVRFFDEEGYSSLRKALRSGQDVESVKPLFAVEVKHPGTFTASWIKSELLALAGVSLLFYFVCKDRAEVIA